MIKARTYLSISIPGRNATGYCFITGIGTKSIMHTHHRPSIANATEALQTVLK